MTIALTSPVTGAAQTGFTSPTYTHVADTAPDTNGKQYAVTAAGGTQVGVTTHSGSSPFTITFTKPKVWRNLGKPNPTTGLIKDVPRNTFKVIVRKGMTPAASQPYQIGMVNIAIDVPSGADTYDAANVRAMLSAAIGALSQVTSGLGDTVVSNIIG